jgi:hypothetical protein
MELTMKMELTSKNVEEIFLDCFFKDDEIVNGKPTTEPIIAEGVILTCGFNEKRLKAHKTTIIEMLDQLPEKFKQGWSFLNMCTTKDGVLWGEHKHMEQLVCMGIAIGKIKSCTPREYVQFLPGGVPYYQIMP